MTHTDPHKTAIFAAGCFWGVEHAFRQTPGVINTEVGYTGGTTENPTYEQVCTDQTGHAEAVRVVYDPAATTFEKLLDVFFGCHDPTQRNRQGADIGRQYRSGVYHLDHDQKAAAEAKIAALSTGKPIATEVRPASTFYRAEEYHQRYVEKNGGAACGI